jgi:hypothetical protein
MRLNDTRRIKSRRPELWASKRLFDAAGECKRFDLSSELFTTSFGVMVRSVLLYDLRFWIMGYVGCVVGNSL